MVVPSLDSPRRNSRPAVGRPFLAVLVIGLLALVVWHWIQLAASQRELQGRIRDLEAQLRQQVGSVARLKERERPLRDAVVRVRQREEALELHRME